MSKFIKRKRTDNPSRLNQQSKTDWFPPKEDQLTQTEVAEMFGRTIQTIINWKKNEIIPYYQLGDRPVYSKSQLIELASKNQHLLNEK